jgi:hypothetical protein
VQQDCVLRRAWHIDGTRWDLGRYDGQKHDGIGHRQEHADANARYAIWCRWRGTPMLEGFSIGVGALWPRPLRFRTCGLCPVGIECKAISRLRQLAAVR